MRLRDIPAVLAFPVSIRTKLFLGTGLVILCAALAALIGISGLIDGFVRGTVYRDLEQGIATFEKIHARRQAVLEHTARTIAVVPNLHGALASAAGDSAAMLVTAHQARDLAGTDFVAIANARGKLLADTLHPESSGEQAPDPNEHSDCEHGVFLIAAADVHDGAVMVGQLIVGEKLGDVAARELREQVGADVTILHYGRPVVRSWSEPDAPPPRDDELTPLRAAGAIPGQPLRLSLGGRECVAVAVPLTASAQLMMSRSIADLMELYDQIWQRILIGGLIATAIALALSQLVAHRLSVPIRHLTEAAREIAGGNFHVEAPRSSTQELMVLATSFNRMARRIAGLVHDGEEKARVLEQQKRALESSNQAKSHLLTNASHELLTPVTNVCASTEILLEHMDATPDSPQAEEFLRIIQDESQRIHRLVVQILDMAMLEGEVVPWRPAELDLADVLRASVGRCASGDRGATPVTNRLMLETAVGEHPYRGDRERLEQVFDNLLSNALKFSDPGTEVRVRLRRANDGYLISVADRGPGIPGEVEKERIFETFAQRGDLLTEKPSGTGLGLAITRSIVRAHGGDVLCRDNPSGGSVFVVLLPTEVYDAPALRTLPAEEPLALTNGSSTQVDRDRVESAARPVRWQSG